MANTSSNRTFHDVLQIRLSRRSLVAGGLVTAATVVIRRVDGGVIGT